MKQLKTLVLVVLSDFSRIARVSTFVAFASFATSFGACGAEEETLYNSVDGGDTDATLMPLRCEFQRSAPNWVLQCPAGQQCLYIEQPACYATSAGICAVEPTSCPEPGPNDAVVAICTAESSHAVVLPPDGIYASECEARLAGYVWLLEPVAGEGSGLME
jgi:hypothetical protein